MTTKTKISVIRDEKKYRKRRKKINLLLVLNAVLLFFILSKNIFKTIKYEKIPIKDGVVDLNNFNYNSNNMILLGGEWEFYWEKLLYHKDFKEKETPNRIVKIPSVWNSYSSKEQKITEFGYATFRLHITNAKIGEEIALRINPLSTSYRLYIDDDLMAQNGIVGKSRITSKPEYKMQVFRYTPKCNEFDIIFHISNYTYARGGMWWAPQFGTVKAIYQFHNFIQYRDLILLGCFFIMAVHSVFIYLLRKKEKNYLPFAIMCIFIIARISVYSSYMIVEVFKIKSLEIIVRTEYLSLLWLVFGFLYLIERQFENIALKVTRVLYYKLSLILTGLIIILPIHIFTKGIYIIEFICLTIGIYILFKLFKAYLLGVKNAFILNIAAGMFFICSIHDLLLQHSLIFGSVTEYMPVGFLIFMICEDFILARNYIETLQQNEEMVIKIERVTRREYETNLKFLKSQIKPHFIHNALNSIIAISRTDMEKTRELLLDFSQYIRSSFDFDNLDHLVPIEHEINFIHSYLTIEKTRFGDSLLIEYDIEDTNILIPSLILQPLVENAVVHGIRKKLEDGKIVIYVRHIGDEVCIGVMDDGVGIDLQRVNDMLKGNSSIRGVGLYNINQRLLKLYNRSLIIESVPSGGTNIYMKIPGGHMIESSSD